MFHLFYQIERMPAAAPILDIQSLSLITTGRENGSCSYCLQLPYSVIWCEARKNMKVWVRQYYSLQHDYIIMHTIQNS